MFSSQTAVPRRRPRALRWLYAAAVLALLSPYTTSWGSGEAAFTFVNHTGKYLHAIIGRRTYAYIGPGSSVTYELSTSGILDIEITYSPGQGVKGQASTTAVAEWQTSGESAVTNDCSNNNGTNSCSQSSTGSYSSRLVITPSRWVVTADSLSTGVEEGGQP